jgi:hypothetical protein
MIPSVSPRSNALDNERGVVFFVVVALSLLLFLFLFGNAMDTSARVLFPSSFEAFVRECNSQRKETSSNSCAISQKVSLLESEEAFSIVVVVVAARTRKSRISADDAGERGIELLDARRSNIVFLRVRAQPPLLTPARACRELEKE